jgi:tetratricopeptide (TPR) repeat protein
MLPIGPMTLTLAAVLAATARADDVVLIPDSTVKGAIGGRIKGTIQSESPSEVVVKLGNTTTTVPTGEIASIKYDGQPPSMVLADSKESGGLLAEAADLYKKAASEASGKPFVQEAALAHQAQDIAELALSDPGRVAEAITLLDAFVKAHPKGRHVVAALDSLARLQLGKGDYAAADKTLAEMARQPQSADRAAVLRATISAKQGHYDKAIAEYDKLIADAKDGSVRQREARLAKAEALAGLKKYDQAEAEVRSVIKAAPPEDAQIQSAAYNTLGDCLRAANKPKDALLAYLHTHLLYAKDKEQDPRALAQISRLWRELKRDDRADDAWATLKREYPQSPWLNPAKTSGQ